MFITLTNRLIYALIFALITNGAIANTSRAVKAKQDIRALETAINLFKKDYGRYPTTKEGLDALVSVPEELRLKVECGNKKYLDRLPKDPWGNSYQYRYPAEKNVGTFDLWSYGADGNWGGKGVNLDIGNWPESNAAYESELRRNRDYPFVIALGAILGFVFGFPVYIFGFVRARLRGFEYKSAMLGFHFGVLIYLTSFVPLSMFVFALFVNFN